MEMLDRVGQFHHELAGQTPLAGHFVQESALIEPAHHKQPVDRLAGTSQFQALSVGAERNGHDRQIKLGRCPGIYFELPFDDGSALFEGGEIKIGKLDRALEFISPVTREENDCGVSPNKLDSVGLRVVLRI